MSGHAEVLIDGREYVSKDWHGLMAILRDIYPEDIFTGSSGDPGPVILTLVRRVDRLRLNLADVLSTFTQKGYPGRPAVRSDWQNVERVEAWRKALREESPTADVTA